MQTLDAIPDRIPELLRNHRSSIHDLTLRIKAQSQGNEDHVDVNSELEGLIGGVWSIFIEYRSMQILEEMRGGIARSAFLQKSLPFEPRHDGEPLMNQEALRRHYPDNSNANGISYGRTANYTGFINTKLSAADKNKNHFLTIIFTSNGASPEALLDTFPGHIKSAAVETTGGCSVPLVDFKIVIDAEDSVTNRDNILMSVPVGGSSAPVSFQIGPADPPDSPIRIYVFQANRMIQGLHLTRPT